jgi:hypothetical protein
MEEEKIKEFIFQAHQAGKSETSQLFKEIKDEVSSIKEVIAEHGFEIKNLRQQVEQSNHIDENLMKLHVEKENQEERKKSDSRYAIKIVEKIVFWAVTLIGIAFFTALISQVIPQ